ncbi:MAG: hypothetical protein BV456_06470 [Thermoplasmata archaeon M8B2D]|nr:MAG: hypothetical protein BV456_06470 [Thermoplasmata archaeon M8B2D]
MIKSLILKNYKSYRDQRIDFDNGITVIRGEGLSGKSNIVKAIKLIKNYRSRKNNKFRFALNRSPMQLELINDDNQIILTENDSVVFQIKDKLTRKFKRKKTPTEVKQALALSSVNIQSQLEQPLIVENNSSQLSKLINRIIGVNRIDSYIKDINSQIKINKAMIEKDTILLEQLEKNQIAFQKLPQIKKKIDRANTYRRKIEKIQNQIADIELIVESINQNNQNILNMKRRMEAQIKIDLVMNIKTQIEEKQSAIRSLRLIIDNNQRHSKAIIAYRKQFRICNNQYIEQLENQNNCPYCFQELKPQTITNLKKKLKNEVYPVK